MEEIPNDYIIAEGPAGLRQVLEDLYAKTTSDPVFATEEHFVLYQLGNQKSLIKVDTGKTPFDFWHYDLLGRPATAPVKETLKQFMFEKWGVTE